MNRRPMFIYRALTVKETAEWFGPDLAQAHAVVVDELSEWYWGSEKENWYEDTDLPTIAPPFESVWLEYEKPKKIVMSGIDVTQNSLIKSVFPDRLGILLHWMDPNQIKFFTGKDFWVPPNARWAMGVKLCSEKDGQMQVYHSYRHCYVDAQGKWIPCGFDEDTGHERAWNCLVQERGVDTPEAGHDYSTMVNAFCWPGYLGIAFMHCRNIQTIQTKPEENKSYRRWINRGNQPIEHSHLVISKLRNASRRISKNENVGLHHAMHFCRGHFKTYTVEHPLFGKHVGHWFWNDSVRGDSGLGQTQATYEVKR